LLKNRQFTLLNLIGLSSALACVLFIFLWVKDELSVDTFNEKDEQIYKAMYSLKLPNEVLTLDYTPYPLVETAPQEMPEVERAVAVNGFMDFFAGKGVASYAEKAKKVQGIFASKDFFNVFSYPLLEGNKDLVLAKKAGVVISKKLAQTLFGRTTNLIGIPLQWTHKIDLGVPLEIAGVFENPPANASRQFDIIFNFSLLLDADPNAKTWNSTYSETYFLLKEGTDPEKFGQKIEGYTRSKAPGNEICSIFLQKFSDQYLHGTYENGKIAGGRIQYLRLFSLIALFILLIACINFINLYTVQALDKMKEVGVKKSLGAGRGHLIAQFFGETLLLTSVAMFLALFMVWSALPVFNNITGKQLIFNLDSEFLLAVLGAIVISSVLAGAYPALYLSGFKPIAVLKGKLTSSPLQLFTRKGLVVFQFVISFCFIVGFIAVKEQIAFIQSKNLGYDRSHIITFQREGNYGENPEAFLAALKALPGVENVATMPESILNGKDAVSGFSWRGQKSDEAYLFKSPRIGYDVIETLGIKLKEGRSFSKNFIDDGANIILNESAVHMMGLTDPIGKIVKQGNFESRIIGVVQDFQYGSLHQAISPLIFRFRGAELGQHVLVKVEAGKEQATLKAIESKYRAFHPKYTFDYSFLDEDYQALYAAELRISKLSNYFAALSILISCLGLFGLVTFAAQRRKKEIGVRKVLGASVAGIVRLLSKDFLALVLIAIVIASPLAWYGLNRWLAGFAYRVELNVWMFATAGLIAVLIAFLTIGFQSVKAALANPVKSLRSE
jgi:ABC-type antimicrobial peptide transport system permease subunit